MDTGEDAPSSIIITVWRRLAPAAIGIGLSGKLMSGVGADEMPPETKVNVVSGGLDRSVTSPLRFGRDLADRCGG
jgi:hypothetical protein